ncbi:hypothetical protein SEA_CHRIS_87 [Mycobacterium phage Chris]|uniref:Uncharacterized protein n=1 Tax=Mycobacterium phage Chris TaxID=2725626 RepID=A0A6M3SXX1_9CAUD|nr:hypothetical protein I5G96_gp018 [Mycobacterium phage Chris]QJD50489.1 hypothetical protein SEA_CHRIS_87 [Mycobacterium phage Chris]
MSGARVHLSTPDRQHGMTTTLLDVAAANARRGARVVFVSPTHRQSSHAARMVLDLLRGDSTVSRFHYTNGMQTVWFRSTGSVLFLGRHLDEFEEYDVEVYDGPGELGSIVRRSAEVRRARR